MTIKEIKKAHHLSDKHIAEAFGYKSTIAYCFSITANVKYMNSKIMEVYIITREDGHYYGSYEVYKVVDSEEKAKQIVKDNPDYRYDEFVIE